MKKLVLIALTIVGAAVAAPQAKAGVSFNISIGHPDFREFVPAPVYLPAPVVACRPAPVVVCRPEPVVCRPAPVVCRPEPVVCRPAPRVVYEQPSYGYYRDGYQQDRSHRYPQDYSHDGRNHGMERGREGYTHPASYDRQGYRPEVADRRHY